MAQRSSTVKTNQGYTKMQQMMADFASSYLDPAWKKRVAGESHELPTDGRFADIFYGFTEISSTLETLNLTEELLRLSPPRSQRIDKDSYLKFLVGSYLQEMYILEQRLSAYASRLSRLYRKPSLPAAVRRVVFEPLENIIHTRGAHVHQRRFSDDYLDMVSTSALFHRVGHELGKDLAFDYKLAQRVWNKRVRKNNQATCEIVDQYFTLIENVICKDGEVFLPK